MLLVAVTLIIIIGYIAYRIYKIYRPSVQKYGKGRIKVACVGDSITYGLGVEFGRRKKSYPAILAEYLGESYQVLNYGLSNRTLLSTGDMPYQKEKHFNDSLNQSPDIVILMLGTNDSKGINWDAVRFKDEYIQIICKYQEIAKHPEIYIMAPPRTFIAVNSEKDCNNDVIKNEVCKIVANVAQETGANLIDLYELTELHGEWMPDGIHPNAVGNRSIAKTIYEELKKK